MNLLDLSLAVANLMRERKEGMCVYMYIYIYIYIHMRETKEGRNDDNRL
jgi:hypothetical protein